MSYIKLTEAPTLTIRMPDCDACSVEVESDGDGWLCPVCGTSWPYDGSEDEPGTLYEEWSGEDLEGPAVPNDDAHHHGGKFEADRLQKILGDIAKSRIERAAKA